MNAAKLGTVTRSGGVLQVTYGGKPLYWFVGDTSAGQVNGNVTDKWGKWSAVVTKTPSARARAPAAPVPGTQRRHRRSVVLGGVGSDVESPCPRSSSPPRGRRALGVRARRPHRVQTWSRVSSRVYLPACSIAALAAVLVAIGWADHWGGSTFGGSLTSSGWS